MSSWWLYMVEKNGRLYTGITTDLDNRSAQHASPLIFTEHHDDRQSAASRERQIKHWSRAKKLALASGDTKHLRSLSKCRTGKPPGGQP